jgi:hypothetical protein
LATPAACPEGTTLTFIVTVALVVLHKEAVAIFNEEAAGTV